MLDFGRLQSQLRRAILARISSGQISGSRLARITGFKQPHITNFLHRKRGLSVEAMDRVLKALEISALDLIPERKLERFVHAGSDTEYEAVPLVNASAIDEPLPRAAAIRDWVKMRRKFLARLQRNVVGRRDHWLRFVLMSVADEDAEAMYPRLRRGAMVLVDRHYNSLEAHAVGEVNLYVMRVGEGAVMRSAEVMGTQIVLRPENITTPLAVITMDKKQRYAEKIVGRVAWQAWEM